MKVLIVNTIKLEKNGVTTFILNSSYALKKEKVDVSIAASNDLSTDIKQFINEKNISFIKLPNRKRNLLKYFLALIQLLNEKQYDVIHINGNSTTMSIELLAAKITRTPIRIAHSHNTITEHPMINRFFRPVFESTVNGRIACNTAAGKWLFKDKKFLVIKNGIWFEKYKYNLNERKSIRKKLNLKSTDIVLGHVGFFNYQKNQNFFINLAKKLDSKYKFLLIGDGDLFQEFKNEVKRNKLTDRILTIGSVSNVPDYLSAMDIFLLPSRFEGQPFVIIEALAAGLPCIISDKVSTEVDITKNNFFEPLDVDFWVKTINKIQIDDRILKSEENQKILKKNDYDASQNGIILKNYYQNCINSKE